MSLHLALDEKYHEPICGRNAARLTLDSLDDGLNCDRCEAIVDAVLRFIPEAPPWAHPSTMIGRQ